MPWKSEKQRKWMWAKKPELVEKWAAEIKKAQRSKQRKASFKRKPKDD